MGYIIGKDKAFVNTKLTEKGREKLANGKLNFKYWSLGDSEINYKYEEIKDSSVGNDTLDGKSKILKPIDNEPNFTYFISKPDSSTHNELVDDDIHVIKAVVNNKAEERGFFDDNKTIVGEPYIKKLGTVLDVSKLDGTNKITIDDVFESGDLILLKVGEWDNDGVLVPIPNLWFKITNVDGNTYTLDRNLPNYSTSGLTNIQYFIYAGGDIYENGMANDNVIPYWNPNTLSFEDGDDITANDVPFLNMNIVWGDNMIGLDVDTDDTDEQYYTYGSNDYIGNKSPLMGYYDSFDTDGEYTGQNKGIGIIHYTNNSISNGYGEMFYINDTDKNLNLNIPNIMYHRRDNSTAEATEMGMNFISHGDVQKIENSEIKYVNLIEDPELVNGDPFIIGKILIEHKMIIIEDDEILAALSYKSNRNWTLPELDIDLVTSNNGKSGGVLPKDSTVYVTYALESDTLGYSLPCLNYAKLKNETSCSKDIRFNINDIDQLGYMRKLETSSDGFGFNANNFIVLFQIVAEGKTPNSGEWVEYDFTSSITGRDDETISPIELEKPNQSNLIDVDVLNGSGIYSLNDKLSLKTISGSDNLQFGDERFFYGNLNTYIGATIYKTIFNIKISGNQFVETTNPTKSDNILNDTELRVSEIGIYSEDKTLVFVGKISNPIKIINGKTVTIELSMDF